MKGMHFKSEIAQLALDDFSRRTLSLLGLSIHQRLRPAKSSSGSC